MGTRSARFSRSASASRPSPITSPRKPARSTARHRTSVSAWTRAIRVLSLRSRATSPITSPGPSSVSTPRACTDTRPSRITNIPDPGVRASMTTWPCGNSTSVAIAAIRSSDSSDNPPKIGTARSAFSLSVPRPATLMTITRLGVALRDPLRHVGGNVADLLLGQLVAERRHAAAAVRDLRDHRREARGIREVRAAVAARAVSAVAARAVRREDRLALVRVPLLRSGLLAARFPAVLAAGAAGRSFRGAHRPVEPEEPELVAVGRGHEAVALREEDDVLLAVVLEEARGVVRACARLEVPEPLPVPRVVRLEFAVRASEEDEVALRRARSRVTRLREPLLPDAATAEGIDGRERAPRLGVRGAGK